MTEPLRAAGRSYLYEAVQGEVLFPTPHSFVEALSRAKVSVCFPSSLTHPERSGCVETMTQRYLQSMASGCLVVGKMPGEMRELFGYEAVVDADMERPAEQLLEILASFDEYAPLIERNLSVVREHHSWARRWETIARCLAEG